MTQRARNIVIIAVLAVLIAAGAVGIYYFSGGLGTGVGLVNSETGGQAAALSTHRSPTDSQMNWLNCTKSGVGAYNQPAGAAFDITYTCTNSDTVAHSMDVEEYDLRAPVFERPDSGVCVDPDDRTSENEWPPFYDHGTMFGVIPNAVFANQPNWTCEFMQQNGVTAIQSPAPPTPHTTTRIDFNPGEHKTFTTSHSFAACDYYQYDDMAFDSADPSRNTYVYLAGDVQRSYGAPAACGYVAPQAALGNLEVRMYEDADGNKEYSTPTAGGSDNPFPNEPVTVTNSSGQPVANCTGPTGGAGRVSCFQVPVGRYRVQVSNPDSVKYSGPIVDTTANPAPGEQHNANGVEDLTLTVVEAPQPQGTEDDVVTYYDFGYNKKDVTADITCTLAANPATGVRPLDSTLTVTMNPANTPIAGIDWDFGDGQTITTVGNRNSTTHTYQTAGDFTAKAAVTEGSGGSTVNCQTPVKVTQGQPSGLSCVLAASPASGVRPLTTTLTVTMNPTSTQISRVDWVFGDGQTGNTTAGTTSHTYQNVGVYTAVANVTTTQEEQTSCQTTVTVTQFEPTGISCVITANPAKGISPLDTTLATAVTPPNTNVDSYVYDFGDGSPTQTTSQNTIQHTYTGKKTYTASVSVTDNSGQVADCSTTVEVDMLVVPGSACRLEVVDYLDLDKDLIQDPGIIGYIDPGMDGARVTIQATGGTPQTKVTAPVPGTINRYGEAAFEDLACGTYTVSIDETSQVTVGGTTQQYILNRLQRLEPPATSTQVTLSNAQPGARVEFGYTPRVIEAFLCDIDKTVADTSAGDEGNPDDPKVTNSSPGETLTYTIDWDCSGFPTSGPLAQSIGFVLTDDFYDPLLTLVPGSITGGGVYNQSQGIITWNITGATNVDQGSVSFQATIASNLAPGTYVLPNYVVAVGNNGTVLDQDQTVTNVVVPEGPEVVDVEVIKYATDVNGGQVLPGDVLQYYVVVWNNGNTPLNNVTVTENVQPNVNNFRVITIPAGATDNSTPTGGSNGTGYLNVTGINLPNRGDTATITFQVTVNAGVPSGTQLVNFVTAAADGDQDTDDETVVVGTVLPTPPPAPPAGPGPTVAVSGTGPAVPPLLGARAYVPPVTSGEPTPAPETGVGAIFWILMASLVAAFGSAGYLVIRQRSRSLEY